MERELVLTHIPQMFPGNSASATLATTDHDASSVSGCGCGCGCVTFTIYTIIDTYTYCICVYICLYGVGTYARTLWSVCANIHYMSEG